MSRKNVASHSVARRVAMASMTVLAASGVGLVAAPMAFGQIIIPIGGPLPIGGTSQSAGVTNSGSASANTGGNTAVGNNSTNTATSTNPVGGAVSVPVDLGAGPTNTSEGTAAVTTAPASAVGNSSDTTVGQSNASGTQVNSFLSRQAQDAGVANAGSASANSGGNTAIGNNSTNTASVNQASGGLVGVGVTLGGPVNNSTGSATVNSGAANAVGNSSDTTVGQASQGGGSGGPGSLNRPGVGAVGGLGGSGVGPGPCNAGRFATFQDVSVRNQGQAQANTGNNVAIGNNSTNNASTDVTGSGQTVSGGLLGVGITIGGPVNNSSGTAVINTGPASAIGNDSVTTVGQTQGSCPQVTTFTGGRQGPGVFVPAARVQATSLARTGLDTGDLGMIAGALLGGGMLLVASQRRRMAARSAAVPMAGFGLGLGGDDWDRAVR